MASKRTETLKQLKKTLEGLVGAEQEIRKEDEQDNEALKLVLFTNGIEDLRKGLESNRLAKEDVLEALRNLKIDPPTIPDITIPDIKIPEITVPEPKVTVNIPEIKVPKAEVDVKIPEIKVPEPKVTVNVPDVIVPEIQMPDEMEVTGNVSVNNSVDNPIPTRIVDRDGNDVSFQNSFSGGGARVDKVSLSNTGGEKINPATEEKQGDTVSTVNSSTTALNNGENFTGTWEDADGYSSIKVAVKTDQNGYYEIQFSPDGTNVDSTLTRYYRTTQIEPPHKFEVMRQYVRVRFFNNSGSNQTYFRLQTIFSHSAGMLNIPVDANMSQDYDATATRPTDFKYEVALGRRQGYSLFNKFGYNTDIDTATDPEIVAAFGGTSFTPLTTASTLTIVSSSSDDDGDPAGTGAQTILITGIDTNRDFQQETVTLNGTTNVVTTSTWLGINRAVVVTSGSNDANVGNITITATTGGSTQAFIPAGQSVTQQLIFFNYRNHVALIEFIELNALRFGSGTEPTVTFKGWVYSGLVDTKYEIFRESVNTNIQTNVQLNLPLPLPLTEQDVFWIEAETTRDDTSVSGRFSLITVRDVDA